MYGYIFLTENIKTGKKFIGKFASVGFDKKHLGDNPGLISDVEKYGAENFTVKMLRACESKQYYDMAYDAFIKEYCALTDSKYYNCEKPANEKKIETDEPVKKSRKKKVEE